MNSKASASVLRQPKPFYAVFMVEFWERFGFYGMWAILAYYFVKQMHLSEAESYNLFSAFTALLYALTSIGGYIGDKIVGTKRTIVIGTVFLMAGYFLLGFHSLTFTALGVIAVGNGLFKANPASLLSKCYESNDPRLDGAFTMYYMSVNIGSGLSMLLVPTIQSHFGFSWGFWAASIGLVIGLANYLMMYHWMKGVASEAGKKPIHWPKLIAVIILAILGVFACSWILQHLTFAHWLMTVIGIAVGAFFITQIVKAAPHERWKMIVALILMIQAIAFFILYQQMPTSLNFFAINNVQHSLYGWHFNPLCFQALNPIWIVIASPILAYFYNKLGNNGKDFSMPAKFTMGMFLCALGFLSLYMSTFFANASGIVSPWWMVLSYGFQSVGELLVSGLGLAMVARLVPQRMMGLIMGAWFMVTAVAMVLGGFVAALTNTPANAPNHFISLHIYGHVFFWIGCVTLLVTLLMWPMVPFLRRRMA